jgi:chromosome segregation ATPase
MTLQELLKENGIGEEVIEKITAGMKENKIFTASEENLDVRYGKLKTDHEGVTKQLEEANGLIDQLKKSTKGNEDLQTKIKDYESQVDTLQNELKETKIKSAIKVALLSEKALDVDYLTFKLESKLKEDGTELELDDNDNIKGWDNMLSGLKTQFPAQFESSSSSKKIEEHKLEQGDENNALTKEQILKKPYAERMKIYNDNPDAYHAAMEKE